MTAAHRSRNRRLLLVMALLIGFAALTAGEADARHRDRRAHRRPRAHRVVVVPRAAPHCNVAQGFWGSPVIYVGPERFHWSALLGLYVPKLWLEASYGEWAPRGSVYYDPYCGRPYRDLSTYRIHLHDCGHPAALVLAAGARPMPRAVPWGDPRCGGH